MGLDARLRLARTIVVTGTLGGGDVFRDHVVELFRAGADIVQLRDTQASRETLLDSLEVTRSAAMQLSKTVAVTSDVDLAKEFGADLLVLPASGMDPGLAHAKLHEYALVGRSVHDEKAAEAAAKDSEINFALVGPVYLPANAPFPAPGLDLVRAAAERMPVGEVAGTPWFATGGVDLSTIDEILANGARRVSITVDSPDDAAVVKQLADRLRLAWVQDPALKDYAFGVFGMGAPRATFRSSGPTAW